MPRVNHAPAARERPSPAPRWLAALLGCCLPFATTAEEAPAGGEHHAPHSVLGVFIGDTVEDRRTDERRDGLTLGLEYEYRAAEHFGVGLTAEYVGGDADNFVFVLPVAYHSGPWKLYAGPGLEVGEGHSEPLLRVGAEYGFHVGDYEISPQLDLDFVNGERLFIFGVVFAREF